MSLTILVDVQQTGYTITTLQCFIPLTILVGVQHQILSDTDDMVLYP